MITQKHYHVLVHHLILEEKQRVKKAVQLWVVRSILIEKSIKVEYGRQGNRKENKLNWIIFNYILVIEFVMEFWDAKKLWNSLMDYIGKWSSFEE